MSVKPYYEQDGVTIYHGDCRELIGDLVFDVVITDPPYGVNFKGKKRRSGSRMDDSGGYSVYHDTPQQLESTVLPFVNRLVANGARVLITPGRSNQFKYPEPKTSGTIFQPAGCGMNSWGFTCSQPIYYYGKDPYLATRQGSRPDSFSSTERAAINGHPCTKPIGVMRWLVARGSLTGETILDPFMGSGSTLIAAIELDRRAIGVEIDERYCEIAAKRLQQAQASEAA